MNSKQAKWRVIEEALSKEILTGAFGPDGTLPADSEVAKRFGASRLTARKALASLQSKGLIRIVHGKGTFIEQDVIQYRILHRMACSQNILESDSQTRRQLLSHRFETAAPEIADRLRIPEGTGLLIIDLLRFVGNRPLAISRSFLDAQRYGKFVEAMGEQVDVERALLAYGVSRLKSKAITVFARMPTSEEAALLDQSMARPVVQKENADLDDEEEPFRYHVACYAADRIKFVFDRE
ncbi:phosphonate metabolism transcriptional regulator PhnF (plasmid) [Sinorhizobium numidicum]|uniref:Phosphonate metabolism transcriptional regulator PhnF n=1 Tax=Sinorhizobium numidicum TaxID=680248 RepID=A0ABY8D6H1_9HYPH|nr:phosphonate metabolism transcriptional regulator PhnF [Sinorhizobium numidicum]WEX79322.1 phosphonate metabolism transcriptional regulator PhnF [Sinorhizobium numidicum]WEX85307.1 phosphonate metabolism transcriptional regulator PhnF [Sinorhizobium numidicum]